MVEGTKVGAAYVELTTDDAKLVKGLSDAKSKTAAAGKEMADSAEKSGSAISRGFSSGFSKVGDQMVDLGKKTALATAALGAGITGLSVFAGKMAIDFESAFAGVRKTVDATEEEFASLKQGIRDMAKEVPVSAKELASIAEAGGQLGIAKENLLDFTRTMAMVAETTNLTSEEAATSFAQIANVTQMPQENIDRLASTVVALGNAGASTEADITAMSLRIAGAGHTVGMTEPEIVGFAAALADVGIKAEMGGTAISQVMVDMASAIAEGGEDLTGFATVAGMTADQFAAAFKERPAAAILAFVQGLGDIQREGGNVFGTLEALGLNGDRVRETMLKLASNNQGVATSLAIADEAWVSNNALQEEAAKRHETTAAKMQIARNEVNDLAITIGEMMLPAIANIASGIGAAAEYVQAFIRDVQELGLSAALLERGFSPEVVAAIVAVVDAVAALGSQFRDVLEPTMRFFAENNEAQVAAFGALAAIIGVLAIATAAWVASLIVANAPILAVIAATALLGAGIAVLVMHWDDVRKAIDDFTLSVGRFELAVASKVRGAVDAMRDALGDVGTAFKNAWNSVEDFLHDLDRLPERARGALGNFAGEMYDAGIDGLHGLWDGVTDGADQVLDFLFDLPGEMLNAVGDLGDLLWDAGIDMLQGLWDGAKSKASDFLEWMASLPGEALNWLKTAADGHSPWGVMIPPGEDMIAGLQVGVANQMPVLANQVASGVGTILSAAANAIESFTLNTRWSMTWLPDGGGVIDAGYQGPQEPFQGPMIGVDMDTINRLNAEAAERIREAGRSAGREWLGGMGDGIRGGGGGGGAGGSEEEAEVISAIDAFLGRVVANINHDALVEEFGNLGAELIEALNAAMAEGAGEREGEKLADALDRILDDARENQVPNAEALGDDLINAVTTALAEGTDEAAIAARTAIAAIGAGMKEEAKLTITSLGEAMVAVTNDKAFTDKVGNSGRRLLDALDKAIKEGGKDAIDNLAKVAVDMRDALNRELPPAQAGYYGSLFMSALNDAIEDGSEESIATLTSMLEDINVLIEGGAVDIRTGLLYTGEQVKEFADELGISAKDVVDNFSLLVESGIIALIDSIEDMPDAVKPIIQRIIKDFKDGLITAAQARDAFINTITGATGGTVDAGGNYIPPAPGTTGSIEQGLTDILGFNPFKIGPGGGAVYDANGYQYSTNDLVSMYNSLGPVGFGSQVMYGGITGVANAYDPTVPADGPLPDGYVDPVTGNIWTKDMDPNTPGDQSAWVQPGFRALGGPVTAGMPYWVGERGLPELFVPRQDGVVLSLRDLDGLGLGKGGKTLNVHSVINIAGDADEAKIRRAVWSEWEAIKEREYGEDALAYGVGVG